METSTPKHHIKQEICFSRPAYREGRISKAVKVYTINNESKYILIQGVPAVGAMKELEKRCSSFGEIEEYHVLDDYPCQEKYTEVYLFKFKKIQSARFAKRKMDNYSFFGGILHVCYAPEYETVAETREKLQGRRRIIAAKIRQHKNDVPKPQSSQTQTQSGQKQLLSSSTINEKVDENKSNTIHHNQHLQVIPVHSRTTNHISHSNTPFLNQKQTINENQELMTNPASASSFVLPPPPKPLPQCQPQHQNKYEFSRVPSKHSTLPIGFDGRIPPNQLPNHPIITDSSTTLSNTESNSLVVDTKVSSLDSNSNDKLKIRKDYKPKSQALKFIPRQATKRSVCHSQSDSSLDSKRKKDESENETLRQTAFVLGNEQGPADLPGRREEAPKVSAEATKSYNATIKTIRSKISQVITSALVPKSKS